MSGPTSGPPSGDEWDLALTPARQRDRRDRPPVQPDATHAPADAPPAVTDELLDLERGRTAALIAALGRLQLAVDVLCRDQRAAKEEIQEAVRRIEGRIDGLTALLERGNTVGPR